MSLKDDYQRFSTLVRGFMASRVILSAQQAGIFVPLRKPSTAKSIASALSLDLRATETVLNALVGLGLLKKQKNRYTLTRWARGFVLPESPHYMGNMLEHMDNLWKSWSHLTGILHNGGPAPREDFNHNAFIMAMEDIARWKTRDVMARIELKGVKKALDLGGGPGTYARALARKSIMVTLFDRPETIPIAKELAQQEGLSEKITFRGGDFMKDPLGEGYDLVLVSQVLHAYGPGQCAGLLKRIKRALNKNGTIAIHEFFVKNDLSGPASGTVFGVNMLVNTSEGRVYPVEQIKAMLKKTGFKRPSVYRIEETVLITART